MARTSMVETRNILRFTTAVVWAASVATVILAFYMAQVTGYEYGALTSFRTYNGILTGSAFVLAIVLLVGVLTLHRVDGTSRDLVREMGEILGAERRLPVTPARLREAVNEELAQTPNSAAAQDLQRSLGEYESLQSLRRDLRTLIAAPVGLLSAIFAVSAWALPATEGFLQNVAWLNTTLLFFVSYGMVVAVASALVVAWILLSTGRSTTA